MPSGYPGKPEARQQVETLNGSASVFRHGCYVTYRAARHQPGSPSDSGGVFAPSAAAVKRSTDWRTMSLVT